MDDPKTEIVLHCAAVPTGWYFRLSNQEMFNLIRSWHTMEPPKGRGWRNIGYHYVIALDGQTMTGRPADEVGAHVMGHNRGKLGVLLIERGKIDRIGKFYDYFSEKQRDAVRSLARSYGITKITGHNDYAPKLCPGFKVQQKFFL